MFGEKLWNKITKELYNNPTEVKTVPSNNREPLWFEAISKEGRLVVCGS